MNSENKFLDCRELNPGAKKRERYAATNLFETLFNEPRPGAYIINRPHNWLGLNLRLFKQVFLRSLLFRRPRFPDRISVCLPQQLHLVSLLVTYFSGDTG